jgi:exodeoxyribonuclease-3
LPHWLDSVKADVVCLQEIKAMPEQFDQTLFNEIGYDCYIHSANKKGYSGVAILSKIKPQNVEYGCGINEIDFEGRVIRADYKDFSVMSVYFPSGSSGDLRQEFKFKFLDLFATYIHDLRNKIPNLIICGDFNICHKPIDIHNPVRNKNTSGFLPEERDWMDKFIESGFTDVFRIENKEPHNYTWWSYRANARAKNLGWRIDYIMINRTIISKFKRSVILSKAKHSDHCPVLLEIA